jgi:hypothetical protein
MENDDIIIYPIDKENHNDCKLRVNLYGVLIFKIVHL